jgi:UDP-N-acetylmuramoylalanine--D-glutamate ligase
LGGAQGDRTFLDYYRDSGFARAFEFEDTLMVTSAMNINVDSLDCSAEPTVLVMGMGLTGASCARFFAARGIAAEFADTRQLPPGIDAIMDAMPDARVHTGDQPAELPPHIRRLVVSPGVDMHSPLIAAAQRRKIDIVSDIDLFAAECGGKICAITGSNGKSTVTSMLGSMLADVGWSVATGGNLGTPALDLLDPDIEIFVLELSSFQLERSGLIPTAASVLLNLSPDHLDKHTDMDAYAAAKARVYGACRRAVVNRDVIEFASLVPTGTAMTSFGMDQPAAGEFGIRVTSRGECIAYGDTLLMSVDDFPLLGRHNLANALAALALGSVLGVNPHSLAQALKRYRGLPHRMQLVVEANGITWINDSKATNVGAALTSIESVSDPFVLIAGGDAKGADFEALANALSGRQCSVILLGRDALPISRALHSCCEVTLVETMRDAVVSALAISRPGDTVLLAPACSSHDMFENFAERGDVFATAVLELTS